jgi:hypothetical protein
MFYSAVHFDISDLTNFLSSFALSYPSHLTIYSLSINYFKRFKSFYPSGSLELLPIRIKSYQFEEIPINHSIKFISDIERNFLSLSNIDISSIPYILIEGLSINFTDSFQIQFFSNLKSKFALSNKKIWVLFLGGLPFPLDFDLLKDIYWAQVPNLVTQKVRKTSLVRALAYVYFVNNESSKLFNFQNLAIFTPIIWSLVSGCPVILVENFNDRSGRDENKFLIYDEIFFRFQDPKIDSVSLKPFFFLFNQELNFEIIWNHFLELRNQTLDKNLLCKYIFDNFLGWYPIAEMLIDRFSK